MAGKDAKVLFEYEKTQDDELSLHVGQIIHNVVQVDVGWCEGTLDGARGMFPDNFVEIYDAPPPPTTSSTSNINLRSGEGEKKGRRAKVIYSYAAQCDDELTLELGKMVDIIAVEEEGWFRGRTGTKVGVFPSNFVEEVDEAAAPPSHRAPSPEPPHIEAPAVVDSQTGERQPPSTESKPPPVGGMRGPMLMPGFDPTKARAGLKQTSKSNVAPPEKPSEIKKPPPPGTASTGKILGRARVTFKYDAENDDELTVNEGDMLEILEKEPDGQEGWVKARSGGTVGLIADVFFQMIEDTKVTPPQPTPEKITPPVAHKEPSTKQMVPPPTQKKSEPKKVPPVVPAKMESTDGDQPGDFPVPKTTPLDTSAVKDRPKTKNRPPSSRSNLHVNPEDEAPAEDNEDESTKNLPPWKLELMKKKQQPKLAPKPKPSKPPPATSTREPVQSPMPAGRSGDKVSKPDPPPMARSRLNTGGSKSEANPTPASGPPARPIVPKPSAVKPKQVENKPSPAPQETPAPSSSNTSTSTVSPSSAAAPPSHTGAAAAAVMDNSWKEAFEKLQGEFTSFKSKVMDLVNTLTDDLDKERKHRAALEIDIDRLKKAQRSLVN